MRSLLQGVLNRVRTLFYRPAAHLPLYLPYVEGKHGIEIGGPSDAFRTRGSLPLYARVGALDNCDFSSDTVWAHHTQQYLFHPGRPPGQTFVCDGSALTPIASASYDFLFSCHNLEHFANPIKALEEWKRVLRPGGALILVLPYHRGTFDHRRTPTPVANMLADYHANVGEDDLSHLEEILEKHDLARDPGAGTPAQFKLRSLDNFSNRCLHHHVFDEHNSRELLTSVGFHVLAVDLAKPYNLCLLAHL